MSLRFIIGRPGTGKTKRIHEEIQQELKENPSGFPIIYLVPEQMTFLSESELTKFPEINGMIRAQVYSFTRLAWKVLQEVGGISRYHISSVGLNMLIRKIMEDKKDDLQLFVKVADKPGFIEHIETMLTEFKRYCIDPDLLHSQQLLLQPEGKSKALADKLHDLELIYQSYQEMLIDKYVDSEDYLRLLATSIEKSSYLKDASIYIDGFHQFTPQEYLVISHLMKTCKKVTVALTVDRPFRNVKPDELQLFRMSGEAYATIYDLALQHQITIEEDLVLTDPKRFQHESLQFLQSHFEKLPLPSFPKAPSIELWQANNRRSEIEGIARHIRDVVRKEHARYRDIAILVRNGHEYQEMIETIFSDFDIPYFIDQKQPMLNHPLIELIRSTLEILNSHWRYEPIFRAIKTDLLFPVDAPIHQMREKMDRLENYVLAYGIQGERWINKKRWEYRRIRGLELESVPQTDQERAIEQELNELRLFITAPILRLQRRLKKAQNSKQLCEALYLYLEELEIPKKLENLRIAREESGELVASRTHDQAWNEVMNLLDQFVEMLGNETISLRKFAAILESGLESLKFSIVPPALDQVLIANLEQSRLASVKIAFIIGLNDGVIPAKVSEDGILNDEDREFLMLKGLNLSPSSKIKLLDEEFILYRALTVPSNQLILSYPLADEEGKALLPSPYVKRMKEMFPLMREEFIVSDPSESSNDEQLQYISHPLATISLLTSQLQLKKRNYPIADFWWDVYNFYISQQNWKERASHAFSSLFYKNKTKKLSSATSEELYGDHILASVSRMEQFFVCPFSHFASYGLKLRERDMFKLGAPNIGDLFHGALKWISDEIQKRNISWDQLSREQSLLLAKEAVDFLAPKLQHQILLSSNRYYYIKKKLEQVVARASYVLSEHAKASGFVPIGMELEFGPKAELPPLTFTLKNGAKMELRGRIDRVDKAENEQGTYLRVIDYKSSVHSLDLTDVYYGLDLQMLTYLDIIITYSKQLIGQEGLPAGVLYFHLHNPVISSNKILTIDQIEEEIIKSFKMKGLMLNDPEVIRLMDQTLETGNSQIVSAGLKKDGQLSARSEVATKDNFEEIRDYVRNIYKKAGNDIVSGVVDISPYKIKKETACQVCPFKSVCQFDQSLEENEYRIITPQKPDEILAKIKEETQGNENSYTN
ncbi:helicase-exonuclease AddAB subunit AddB [Heyndrickxia ginsengihumi]|uniref:helicase-exonuclease AddAB subunit AddB n=1 Tax=Heyndrickxia ginsengihumi TaxID=363870 RepID=UPI003D238EC4